MEYVRKTLLKIYEKMQAHGGIRLWLQVVLAFTALFAFIEAANEVMEIGQENGDDGDLNALDQSVLSFLARFRSPLLTQAMTDVTALGSLSVILVFSTITMALLMNVRDRLGVYHLLVVLFGSATIPRALKHLFDRQRPNVVEPLAYVSDSSFPSGHAFTAAAAYLTLAFFVSRYRRSLHFEGLFLILAVLIISLVGVSRMYLGVHYPSDVFAGVCAGSAWSLIVATAFIPLYSKKPGGKYV